MKQPATPLSVRMLVTICWLLLAAFIWLCIDAARQSGVLEGGAAMLEASRWGLVSLVDLYLGLLFIGAWMYFVSARRRWLPLWWVGLACLGNIATLLFVLMRCRGAGRLREVFIERR